MNNALTDLHRLSNLNFFTDVSERMIEYNDIINSHFNEPFLKAIDGEECVIYTEEAHGRFDFPQVVIIRPSGVYVAECYENLERLARLYIKNQVIAETDIEKNNTLINYTIKELKFLLAKVQTYLLDGTLNKHREKIVTKLQEFIEYLQLAYLEKTEGSSITPKIRWLGNVNVLATLFYDLLYGQETPKSETTKVMLAAQKQDIEALLLQNFLDSKGKPLSKSSISDYLNKGKASKRAGFDSRIGLTIPLNA